MKMIPRLLGIFAMLSATSTLLVSGLPAAESKFAKLNKDGTGNIVFASTNIAKGEEDKAELKATFNEGDTIYARAYFSAPMAKLKGEEEGFIDLWIDGKHAKRLKFTNDDIAPGKDQTLIYVYKTTDYSPDFSDSLFSDLPAGEHKMRIIVGVTKFVREGATLRDDGERDRLTIVKDDVHKAGYLSDSTFTFVKK